MNAVGIDVSKGKSTVTICRPWDDVILKPRDFRRTQSDINSLIGIIKDLEGETKVCMEHIGRYYESVATWLSDAGIFVSAVNPDSKQTRLSYDEHRKVRPESTLLSGRIFALCEVFEKPFLALHTIGCTPKPGGGLLELISRRTDAASDAVSAGIALKLGSKAENESRTTSL